MADDLYHTLQYVRRSAAQKLRKLLDEAPAVWDNAEATQIPALARHVRSATLRQRRVASRRKCAPHHNRLIAD